MRNWRVPVRITRTTKCREGFYLLVNGSRLRYATRALAVAEIDALLKAQKIQVVTVREYAARKKHRQQFIPAPVSTAPVKVEFYKKGGEKVAFQAIQTHEDKNQKTGV